jgi:hypothetical protein
LKEWHRWQRLCGTLLLGALCLCLNKAALAEQIEGKKKSGVSSETKTIEPDKSASASAAAAEAGAGSQSSASSRSSTSSASVLPTQSVKLFGRIEQLVNEKGAALPRRLQKLTPILDLSQHGSQDDQPFSGSEAKAFPSEWEGTWKGAVIVKNARV